MNLNPPLQVRHTVCFQTDKSKKTQSELVVLFSFQLNCCSCIAHHLSSLACCNFLVLISALGLQYYVIPWQTHHSVISLNTAAHLPAQFVVMTTPQFLDWDWKKSPQSVVSTSWLIWHESYVCWLKSSRCQSGWNTKRAHIATAWRQNISWTRKY